MVLKRAVVSVERLECLQCSIFFVLFHEFLLYKKQFGGVTG